jgi:two-component system response regulator HydG
MAHRSDSAAQRPAALGPRILVIDDEHDVGEALRQVLESAGYEVTLESCSYTALQRVQAHEYELVVSDVAMAEMNGLELCRLIIKARPLLPVILLTGVGSLEVVIEALRMGARDFLAKPIDADTLLASVARVCRTRPSEIAEADGAVASPRADWMIPAVHSKPMQTLQKLVFDLSGSVASVVIQGATGTGKEVIARALHASSPFRKGPFVALNCAAVPIGLWESELFGHARGAFTDAKVAKRGLLAEADGGTLLLDEIGELPLAMQPKLLRALQERSVRPIGEHREVAFDCRIIAATNRNLEKEVLAKRFREDLYYRLNVISIFVPPLSERGDDLLLLAKHFLGIFAARAHREMTLSDDAIEKLRSYAWPGNVRELENCIEGAVALARSPIISVRDLPERVRRAQPSTTVVDDVASDLPMMPLFELERHHILKVIRLLGGNKTLAATLLGIDRRTLYRRLALYEPNGETPG